LYQEEQLMTDKNRTGNQPKPSHDQTTRHVPDNRPKHGDLGYDRKHQETTVHFSLPPPPPPAKK
jgi:hypothetical protein